MTENEEERFKSYLEQCAYRFLQQMAKQMSLPSNVKKIHLIELIQTKKFHSDVELDNLIQKVKLARWKNGTKRKQLQQSTEITSTVISKSPTISVTPRSSHYVIRYSPEFRPVRHSKIKANDTIQKCVLSLNASDRVLRSYNTVKKPNYIVNNTLIGILKASNSEMQNNGSHSLLKKQEKYQQVAVKSYVNRKKDWLTVEATPISRSVQTSPQPKRQRTVSGTYPIKDTYTQKTCRKISPGNMSNVIIRRPDGRLSKLNAIIQKPYTQHYDVNRTYDVTNTSIESSAHKDFFIPYTQHYDANRTCDVTQNTSACKNIAIPNDSFIQDRLPHIKDVFSRFNPVQRDIMQPIYVEVSSEAEISANTNVPYSYREDVANTTMLENVYNLKNAFLVHQPLVQIRTTTNTNCVYSTPVICTAKMQPPITSAHNEYNIVSVAGDNHHYTEMVMSPRVQDFFKNFTSVDEETYMERSGSSMETLQSEELGATVTIPEMVEDALELISQDGDYMERMGMDIRMQCIICNWAGPKIILEHHIRKEHSSDIEKQDSNEWSITFSCGVLTRSLLWISRVVERDSQLYVLSAKYEQPDSFMATLSTLSSEEEETQKGRITFYNRVTGEPHIWEGEVQQLPPTLPYDAHENCLKLELSRMNLLPNSANLKLINGTLIMNATNKVVVGQPELDNIHINLLVQLLN